MFEIYLKIVSFYAKFLWCAKGESLLGYSSMASNVLCSIITFLIMEIGTLALGFGKVRTLFQMHDARELPSPGAHRCSPVPIPFGTCKLSKVPSADVTWYLCGINVSWCLWTPVAIFPNIKSLLTFFDSLANEVRLAHWFQGNGSQPFIYSVAPDQYVAISIVPIQCLSFFFFFSFSFSTCYE